MYETIVNNSLANESSRSSLDLTIREKENEIMAGIKAPKCLAINSELDMAQEYTEWIELFNHYSNSVELGKKSADIQASTLISCLGRQVLKVLNNLGATDDDKKNSAKIKELLKKHFAPSRNKTYERYQFHRIKQQE